MHEGESSTPFSYSGPLTEAVGIGVVAACFRGRELNWKADALQFDDAEANALVGRNYRDGWAVKGLRAPKHQ